MYSKFENLDEQKRQRILNAAMKEFAAKGYDDASTNAIVEQAGISKGLLFHYFKNKKQLFLYLYRHSVELISSQVMARIDFNETDVFKKLHDVQIVKFDLIRMHPDIMEFLQNAYLEQSPDVRQDLQSSGRELLQQNISRVFQNIDYTLFRSDIDPGSIINTVVWAFEGFANDTLRKAKMAGAAVDYEKMYDDADKYMVFLRQSFYK